MMGIAYQVIKKFNLTPNEVININDDSGFVNEKGQQNFHTNIEEEWMFKHLPTTPIQLHNTTRNLIKLIQEAINVAIAPIYHRS
jgi:hypothetical protein